MSENNIVLRVPNFCDVALTSAKTSDSYRDPKPKLGQKCSKWSFTCEDNDAVLHICVAKVNKTPCLTVVEMAIIPVLNHIDLSKSEFLSARL